MVKIYSARTLPVNPPGSEFVLDRNSLWKALQRKIRHATEFVPAMQKCTVLTDDGTVVVRDAVLKLPNGSLRNMKEEVTSVGEQWIIFRQMEGSITTNLVSHGPNKTDEDLELTYIFEWNFPECEASTPAHTEAQDSMDLIALMAVEKSIATARNLVKSKSI